MTSLAVIFRDLLQCLKLFTFSKPTKEDGIKREETGVYNLDRQMKLQEKQEGIECNYLSAEKAQFILQKSLKLLLLDHRLLREDLCYISHTIRVAGKSSS